MPPEHNTSDLRDLNKGESSHGPGNYTLSTRSLQRSLETDRTDPPSCIWARIRAYTGSKGLAEPPPALRISQAAVAQTAGRL